jgi:gas vesicle protein
MNRWIVGILIGVGVSVVSAVVVLLWKEEKSRRFVQERYQQVRGALPEREQIQQYTWQAATRVSQFADSAKGTAQQMMKKVQSAGSDQGEKAEQLTAAGN